MPAAIPLRTLAIGELWLALPSGILEAGAGRSVMVYLRGTTTQVSVYSDPGLSQIMSQPLTTTVSGTLPGYIAAEQSIDVVDVLSGNRLPAEPLAVADLIGSDGKIAGPGSIGVSSAAVQTGLPPSVESSSSGGGVWTWNADGSLASETLSNGTTRDTFTYNADGTINTFRETIGGTSHVYQYAYDANGNPLSVAQLS